MADEDPIIERSGDEARAGATPGMTRYILGISVVLVIIVFAAILLL